MLKRFCFQLLYYMNLLIRIFEIIIHNPNQWIRYPLRDVADGFQRALGLYDYADDDNDDDEDDDNDDNQQAPQAGPAAAAAPVRRRRDRDMDVVNIRPYRLRVRR